MTSCFVAAVQLLLVTRVLVVEVSVALVTLSGFDGVESVTLRETDVVDARAPAVVVVALESGACQPKRGSGVQVSETVEPSAFVLARVPEMFFCAVDTSVLGSVFDFDSEPSSLFVT